MRKILFRLILVGLLSILLALPLFAATGDTCICGRPYYTEDTGSHMQFDCTGCGKSYYSCTCRCWCGAEAESVDGLSGELTELLCSKCKLPCSDCVCRDRAAYLASTQQGYEITDFYVPMPNQALNMMLSAVFPFLGIASVLFFGLSVKTPTRKEEPVVAEETPKEPTAGELYEQTRLRMMETTNRCEAVALCFRKDMYMKEMLTELSPDRVIAASVRVNEAGHFDDLAQIDGLWDAEDGTLLRNRLTLTAKNPSAAVVQWENPGASLAMFELVNALYETVTPPASVTLPSDGDDDVVPADPASYETTVNTAFSALWTQYCAQKEEQA